MIKLLSIMALTLVIPVLSIAGVNQDLKENLGKSKCIDSWTYNESAFKLYFNPSLCKKKESTATLLTIRYLFESNNHSFPERIELYNNSGVDMESYPFTHIPDLPDGYK